MGLLQAHKTRVDSMTPPMNQLGKELGHCRTARTGSAFLLLNPRDSF